MTVLWVSLAWAGMDACRDRWEADRDDPTVWGCVYGEARAGAITEALAFAREAIAEHPTAQAHLTLGNLLVQQRDPAAAASFEQAVDAFEAQGDVPGQVKGLLNLAVEHRHRGALDEGWAAMGRAADVAGEIEPFVSMVTIERARWVCQTGGDYASFAEELDALEPRLDDPSFPTHGKVLILHTARCLADRLGREAEAHDHEQALIELAVEVGNEVLEVVTLDNALWREHAQGGAGPELAAQVDEALARAVEVDHAPTIADLTCLANELDPQSDFQACLEAVEAMEDAIAARGVGLAASRAADAGQEHVARERAARAVAIARGTGDREALASALARQARVLGGEEARRVGADAVEAVVQVRELQSDELVRSRFVTAWADVFLAQADRLRANDEIEQALRVVERLRGYRALERLDRAAATPRLAPEASRWAERGALLAQIAELDPAEQTELEQLERREAQLREELLAATPAFAQLRSRTVDLDAIRGALEPGEALLVPVTSERPWIAVLTDEGIEHVDAGELASWLPRIDALVGLDPDDPIAENARVALAGALLEPVRTQLAGVRHLVVVPGPVLNAIDWGALPWDGARLDRQASVSYVPSMRTWQALRARQTPAKGATVVVADPTTSRASLPQARQEADEVASLVSAPVVRFDGDEAVESAVLEALGQPVRMLHLAAHAVVDPRDPARSAVLLAPAQEADGRLTVEDVVQLGLPGAVVVLSACEGAAGEEGVEGVHGLAEAFLQAGAKAVVASRVQLRDGVARQLFTSVHTLLAEGARLDHAVAQASSALGVSGVRVIGDGSVAFEATRGGGRAWWLGLVLLLVTAAGGGVVWWRRR